MPRLSRRTSSLAAASPSMNEASQSALVAARPLSTSSGRPLHLEHNIILAEDVDLRMANSNSSEQSALGGQRNPLFEFFASLKLAVVLLAVLIVDRKSTRLNSSHV